LRPAFDPRARGLPSFGLKSSSSGMASLIEYGVNDSEEKQVVAPGMAPGVRPIVPRADRKKDVQTKAYHSRSSEWCRSFILPYVASFSLPAIIHDHLRLPVLKEEKPGGSASLTPGGK